MEYTDERKAGVLVRGLNKRGQRCWLMPVAEGRFDFDGEYLVPPKGAVDPGETELEAGLRELGEETGFWLYDPKHPERSALTTGQVKQLENGESLHNIPLPNHPGVTILHFRAKPHKSEYIGRNGDKRPLAMFEVEVEGIDRIRGLKNSEGKTTADFLKQPGHPRFRDFFSWLQQGSIPATGEALVDPQWFAQMLHAHAPALLHPEHLHGETMRSEWKRFLTDLEYHHREDYSQLATAFGRIKTYAKESGITGGDEAIVKIDTKDTPLYLYTEGAQVVTERDALTKIFFDMSKNEDYNKAIGGLEDLFSRNSPSHRILSSQMAALVPFAAPPMFDYSLRDAVRANGGKPLNWTKTPGSEVTTPIRKIARDLRFVLSRLENGETLTPARPAARGQTR